MIGLLVVVPPGRISRYLANKIALASRLDAFSDTPEAATGVYGEHFRDQVEERLKFLTDGVVPRKNLDVMKIAAIAVSAESRRYVSLVIHSEYLDLLGDSLDLSFLGAQKCRVSSLVKAHDRRIDGEKVQEEKGGKEGVTQGRQKRESRSQRKEEIKIPLMLIYLSLIEFFNPAPINKAKDVTFTPDT